MAGRKEKENIGLLDFEKANLDLALVHNVIFI